MNDIADRMLWEQRVAARYPKTVAILGYWWVGTRALCRVGVRMLAVFGLLLLAALHYGWVGAVNGQEIMNAAPTIVRTGLILWLCTESVTALFVRPEDLIAAVFLGVWMAFFFHG